MVSRQELIEKMKKYGQYPTPAAIAEYMVNILNPTAKSTTVDIACGHGIMLEQLLKAKAGTVHGYDIDPDMVTASRTLVGGRAKVFERDVLKNGLPQLYNGIMANAPFSPDRKDTAGLFASGSKHQSAQFIERGLLSLTDDGRMAIILDRGLCSSLKHRDTRRQLMQLAYIEMIDALPESAFHKDAGTDFSTLILVFSRAPVVETRFLIGGRRVDSVAFEEVQRVGDWFYGPYKYGKYVGSRLSDFVELIMERYRPGNDLNPEVESGSRMLVSGEYAPTKVRRCVLGCLYMSRFAPGSAHPRCAPISGKFHDAGTTNEYYIMRVKDRRDLPWIWYLLNGSDFVQDYMNDMARGMAQKRMKDDEFLAMPFRRPKKHIRKEAMDCFAKALAMRKEGRSLEEYFRRVRDVMRLTP